MANDGDVIITIRMLMVGKEIGGIIGKGGSNVAKFREESGAKITISTAQASPERIVTVSGAQSQIHKAVHMITEKMHSDLNSGLSSGATNKIPVTIQLIVPASQCGSIIGKGGSKIKEIRDATGCSIQVQSDMLPNSSERTVTLSGAPTTIIHCINMLCDVMIQFPAKTATVPYKPHGGSTAPIIFHEGQAYMLQNQYGSQNQEMHGRQSRSRERGNQGGGLLNFGEHGSNQLSSPAPSLCGEGPSGAGCVGGVTNFPCRLVNSNTQELTVGNDIVGCIIGKGGSRIKEIRMLSGAQIKIDQGKDEEPPIADPNDDSADSAEHSSFDRKILIYGTPESISLAMYLINLSVQMFSSNEQAHAAASSSAFESFVPFNRSNPGMQMIGGSGGIPSLLGQPPGLLGSGGNFGSSGLLGSAAGNFGAALTSARRSMVSRQRGSRSGGRYRAPGAVGSVASEVVDFAAGADDDFAGGNGGETSPNGKEKRKAKREKFQPY